MDTLTKRINAILPSAYTRENEQVLKRYNLPFQDFKTFKNSIRELKKLDFKAALQIVKEFEINERKLQTVKPHLSRLSVNALDRLELLGADNKAIMSLICRNSQALQIVYNDLFGGVSQAPIGFGRDNIPVIATHKTKAFAAPTGKNGNVTVVNRDNANRKMRKEMAKNPEFTREILSLVRQGANPKKGM